MSEFNLVITGNIDVSEYDQMQNYICMIGFNDKLTVTIENSSEARVDEISNMVEKYNFVIESIITLHDHVSEISFIRKK